MCVVFVVFVVTVCCVCVQTAELLFGLRQRWQSLFLRRIRSPSKSCSQLDEATIRALVSVLSAEEQSAGLQQPTGIGQRPRPMTADDPPQTPAGWSAAEHQEEQEERSSPDRCATVFYTSIRPCIITSVGKVTVEMQSFTDYKLPYLNCK